MEVANEPIPADKALVPSVTPGREWSLDDPLEMAAVYAVAEQIAFGRSLKEIELDAGMPPRSLFMLWVMQHPAVANVYERARQLSAYALEDDALDLFRTSPQDQLELRWREAKAANLWRSAARRNPQIFSEKAAVNVTVPIQINTSLDLSDAAASQSTKEFPNIYELKADVAQLVTVPTDPLKARVDPATGQLRPARKRLKTRDGRFVKVPKPRAAETGAALEARQEAEQWLREEMEKRRRWRNADVKQKRSEGRWAKPKKRKKDAKDE